MTIACQQRPLTGQRHRFLPRNIQGLDFTQGDFPATLHALLFEVLIPTNLLDPRRQVEGKRSDGRSRQAEVKAALRATAWGRRSFQTNGQLQIEGELLGSFLLGPQHVAVVAVIELRDGPIQVALIGQVSSLQAEDHRGSRRVGGEGELGSQRDEIAVELAGQLAGVGTLFLGFELFFQAGDEFLLGLVFLEAHEDHLGEKFQALFDFLYQDKNAAWRQLDFV